MLPHLSVISGKGFFACLLLGQAEGLKGRVAICRLRPLQNSPKSPKFPPRHLGDVP
uniref:Uncharacterized protein n=1 Tax=Neisseria meningitidis alpha275 TaxID=295996 RepID=C6SM34_NEIME|nr:hypothetical protein predicted by Glimmer/Critica [Neisseria meningitidis alpha275]